MRFVGIDPSTKTGFVAIDESGQVLRAKELTGIGKQDPKRMITLIDDIVAHLQKDDFIVIEGFGFATQQGIMLGGIGWGIRMAMARRGLKYIEVSPSQVKKFCTGKGNAAKDDMIIPMYKHWEFEHTSDNVRDAYVMAQIARSLNTGNCDTAYQKDVIQAILHPVPKKAKKKKVKK